MEKVAADAAARTQGWIPTVGKCGRRIARRATGIRALGGGGGRHRLIPTVSVYRAGAGLRPIVNHRIKPSHGNSRGMSTQTALAVPEATRFRAMLTTVITKGTIQTTERMSRCHPPRFPSTSVSVPRG
ncbi:hypothetical protein GCM10025774_15740 [Microbacterium kyungheense]